MAAYQQLDLKSELGGLRGRPRMAALIIEHRQPTSMALWSALLLGVLIVHEGGAVPNLAPAPEPLLRR